jgi:hypothetical protein
VTGAPRKEHEDGRAEPSYFVVWRNESREQEVVAEYATRELATRHWRSLLALGWPTTRAASIYLADNYDQLQNHFENRVRLVSAGVGDGYWDSPEGVAQRQHDAQTEDE